jgi:dihydroxynaphthoic acid synthetase
MTFHDSGGLVSDTAEITYTDITYEVASNIAWLTINRPNKLNAYRPQTLKEMIAAIETASGDPSCGVIVLSGAGERAFSAGGDVEIENEETFTAGADALDALNMQLYRTFWDNRKPIIAMVDGYAIGGGNHMAYFCDFTIASSRSVFGQNGPRVASPAQGWQVAQAIAVLGTKRAKEMWMLCRRYTAAQALEWGLINAVVEPEELKAEVQRWADELLALSPTTLHLVKRSFDEWLSPNRDVFEGRHLVDELHPDFYSSGEQTEGASAFMEKRKADFSKWR